MTLLILKENIEKFEFFESYTVILKKLQDKIGEPIFNISKKCLVDHGLFVFKEDRLIVNLDQSKIFRIKKKLYDFFFSFIPLYRISFFAGTYCTSEKYSRMKFIPSLFYVSILSIINFRFPKMFQGREIDVIYFIGKFFYEENSDSKLDHKYNCCECDVEKLESNLSYYFDLTNKCNNCSKVNNFVSFGINFYRMFEKLIRKLY